MFLLPYLIDINQYRGEIQAQLQDRLHRPVQLGAMSLAVFPLRVEVKDVSIAEDPRFASKLPFAQVGEMDISVKLLPLLTKSVAIDSLTLKQPANRTNQGRRRACGTSPASDKARAAPAATAPRLKKQRPCPSTTAVK